MSSGGRKHSHRLEQMKIHVSCNSWYTIQPQYCWPKHQERNLYTQVIYALVIRKSNYVFVTVMFTVRGIVQRKLVGSGNGQFKIVAQTLD